MHKKTYKKRTDLNPLLNNHVFFVDSFEEIDVCGNKFIQLFGSGYQEPTDFIRLKYEHNLDTCSQCRAYYADILIKTNEKHSTFPNCCKQHRALKNENWFKVEKFSEVPQLFADKLLYSWHHILHFIDTDQWEEEILDFLEYIFKTFGSFPTGFGEPLYLSSFITLLSNRVKKLEKSKERTKIIVDFLLNYASPNNRPKTDLRILIQTYNRWFNTFPFHLSIFSDLKDRYTNQLPILESTHYNKYLNAVKGIPKTKESLIDFLTKSTNNIITTINTNTLYEKGELSDFESIHLEFLIAERKQSLKEGYLNNTKDPESRYRRILKRWFKDELRFIKNVDRLLALQQESQNMFSDIKIACSRMQENRMFWTEDENSRTKQILDLISIKYSTKDQSQYGISSSGKKKGSVDGVIIDNRGIEHFIEAVNINSLERTKIIAHINKLEVNYDNMGLLKKFLIVYCNVEHTSFRRLADAYKDLIEKEVPFKYELKKVQQLDSDYTNMILIKSTHIRASRETILYHVLLQMPPVE